MTDDKVARCDCGYEATGADEAELVAAVRRHALSAHGIAFSTEDALLAVLRSQLEDGVPDVREPSQPGRPNARGGTR
jgi:predicted small metal-binding protein